ncbi:MAG: penicillin-binding protein 2 [Thermoleophilia bacterium]|nr:penicillin-binding protein 2 [Thermoleophilia bacterium]
MRVPISTPEPRRRLKLPRTLPTRRLQPYSRVDAPYFRSPGFYVRVGGLAVVVGIAICLLVLRAWSIQVLHGPEYAAIAREQAFRTVDIRGPRGAIVDAKGRLLADTTGRIVVTADVGVLGTIDRHGVWSPSREGETALRRFARVAGTPVKTLIARIRRSVLRSPFAPAVVVPHPSPSLGAYLLERRSDFPEFQVNGEPARSYPRGSLGSEFLGLLGEVSREELASPEYAHAKPGEIVGQSGVERTYDRLLNAGLSRARVRVDSLGRIAGPLEIPRRKQPPTLQLTIDARLQSAAERAVRDGMAFARAAGRRPTGGSAVVMDPYTGAILALASEPSFNQARAAQDPAYLQRLYHDPHAPTLDRAIAGVYPTGSTFKPIVAEAALAAGIITPSTPLLCSGSFDLGGFVFHNVEAGVYSSMSLRTALAQSCDTWFYRLGDRIWQSNPAKKGTLIQQWARKLGLGAPTGIDLTGEAGGTVPTPAWFQKQFGYPWTEGQTINLSIGQGALQASPLQMAVAYSALVNGGTVVRPHVASAIIRGASVRKLRFEPVRKVRLVAADAIREGLYMAAHDPGGTSASIFGNFPIPVAGKTGTAETCQGCDDHSWYASFAPYRHPKVVVVVMIEHGGFGAEAAAPAAKEIYEAFFRVKNAAATPGR